VNRENLSCRGKTVLCGLVRTMFRKIENEAGAPTSNCLLDGSAIMEDLDEEVTVLMGRLGEVYGTCERGG
jgi:hypothetical protein